MIHIKQKLRVPFFEVGVKNYVYGDEVLRMGKHLDQLSKKYDIDIVYIVPYTDIRTVAENTENLIVFAPYMDPIRPGRGMGLVLPESVKAAGAKGVLINHCERPMNISDISAFESTGLTGELTIPASVSEIKERAFAELTGVTEISFTGEPGTKITYPNPGEDTGAFYVSTLIETTIHDENSVMGNYAWEADNRRGIEKAFAIYSEYTDEEGNAVNELAFYKNFDTVPSVGDTYRDKPVNAIYTGFEEESYEVYIDYDTDELVIKVK